MHLSTFLAVFFILSACCSLPVNAQWVNDTSIGTQFVEALFADNDKLYAGSDNVLYIRTGQTGNWEVSAPLPVQTGGGVSSIFKTGTRLFAGTFGHGIFESTDNGNTWIPRNNGISTSFQITSFAQRDNNLYTGTSGNAVFTMDLNSASADWAPFRNGLPFNTGAWDVYSLYNFGGTLVSAAGQSGYIYFNESVSEPWYDREFGGAGQSGLTMRTVTSSGNVLLGAASDGFYRSSDSGNTWEYFDPVLGYIDMAKFATKGDKIFAALTKASYGTIIYSTIDSGINWTFEDNLPGVLTLDFTFFSDHLYIAAFDGLWYKPLNPSSVIDDDLVQNYRLYQNYPNPFNPATNITYTIRYAGLVSLKVYDVLGKELKAIINEEQPAGTYEITFDASDLASGVYFYQLRSGNHVQTRKMTVIK